MTKLTDLAARGASLVEAGGEFAWLAPLAELGRHWSDLARAVNALEGRPAVDSVEALLAFVKGKLGDERVVALFDGLGLADLRAGLLAFEDLYAGLPEEVRKLAAPVGSFAETAVPLAEGAAHPAGFRDDWVDGGDEGEIALAIPELAGGETGQAGTLDFTLELGASARIACEAGALWPYSRDAVAPGLVQVSLGAELRAAAGGKLPFEAGTLGASASAGARAEIMYFHRPADPAAIFAAELARALPALPDPFDLAAVWGAMATSGLEGLIVALDGRSDIQVDLALGKALDLPGVLAGTIGVTGTVAVKREAAYVLSVRAQGSAAQGRQRLMIALSRNKSAARSWGVGLGLEVDICPLAERVHALLTEAVGVWSRELAAIRPYLRPGTWMRDTLTSELGALAAGLVEDEVLRAALARDLGVALGAPQADDEGLARVLTDRLAAKLDTVAGLALGQAQAKAEAAVAALVAALPALAAEPARARLAPVITDLVERFQAAVAGEVEAIAANAAPAEVDRALGALGVRLASRVESADQAVMGLRTLIERFDTLLQQALAATEEAARRKIGVQLAFEDRRETGFDMEILAMVDAPTPEAAALYAALVRGKLAPLQQLFASGGTAPGFAIDRERSSIRRFHRISRKTGFAFVAFGFEAEAGQLLSGEAELCLLGNGDLAVVARSELTQSGKGPRESRATSFVSGFDLLMAKADDDSGAGRERGLQRALSLSLTASHRDKSLKAGEVTGFLAGLPTIGLARPDRILRAGEIYEEWSRSGGSSARHPAGDIVVALALDGEGLRRMIGLGGDIRRELAAGQPFPVTRECCDVALEAMLRTGRVAERPLLRNVADLRRRHSSRATRDLSDLEWLPATLQAQRRAGGIDVRTHHEQVLRISADEGPAMRDLTNALVSMNALADILQLMNEIYEAIPAPTPRGPGWSDGDYARHETLLAKASGEWIDVNAEMVFWFRQRMGPQTRAFLLALTALGAGRSAAEVVEGTLGDRLLSITMTPRTGVANEQRPVAI